MSWARDSLRAAGVVFALGLALAAGAESACTTHNCDSSSITVDAGTGHGDGTGKIIALGSGLAWESSDWATGPWLLLHGAETATFHMPPGYVIVGAPLQTMVSTGSDPSQSGTTATTASGQLDEFTSASGDGFSLTNQTCADYYYFVEIALAPAADASTDAALDAHAD